MKNYKFINVLILSVLFLLGCQTEDPIIETVKNENNQSYSVNKVSFQDFQNNTSLLEVIEKTNNFLNTINLNSSSNLNTTKNFYHLDIREAIFIENEEKTNHTYTFPISQGIEAKNIENIVLSSQDDGSYKTYFTKYNLSEEDRAHLNNGKNIDLKNKSSIKQIDYNQTNLDYRFGCTYELTTIYVEVACDIDGCWESEWTTWETMQVWTEVCSGGGGAGTGDSSDNNSGSGGGTGIGSSNNNDNSIPTIPLDVNGESVSNSFLINALNENNTLTRDQIRWINNSNNEEEVNLILNFIAQNSNSLESNNFAIDIINILNSESSKDLKALNFILEAFSNNVIYNNFDNSFLNTINHYTNINTTAYYPGSIQLQLYFSTTCAVLRHRFSQEPGWNDLTPLQQDIKIYWEASKDFVHLSLDIFGMIPVVGEVADLTNGVLYLIEGDGVNATLSLAATIPVVGWGATTGKYVFKLSATSLGTKVRLTWKVLENGTIYFGSSGSKLRKVLGITDSAMHAHHIIPWSLRELPIIQKAAKSGNAFHINEALNGIPRLSNLHLTGHGSYNTKIRQVLDDLYDSSMNVDEAYEEVVDFIHYLENLIRNNNNLNSGQIADLISYP